MSEKSEDTLAFGKPAGAVTDDSSMEQFIKKQESQFATTLEFAGLVLDIRRRELRREGNAIPLYQRAFDALALLVSRREQVVTKEALLDALWPGQSVEENSVARIISDLRKALGIAADSIATVQGRGYRFDAPVRVRPNLNPRTSSPMQRSVAVLPFVAIGGSEAEKQLGFGLADALINRLSSLRNIAVRPTNSVMRYADGHNSAEAGRDLGVELVLSGSIRRQSDKIRITIQLIEIETEASVWAGQFDEAESDIFAMEDKIAARAIPRIASELVAAEADPATRGTENPQAYVLAQRGRYWLVRGHGVDAVSKAAECFREATELDPTFAAAHAGLANTYILGSIAAFAGRVEPPTTMIPMARAAAEAALRLDPNLGEAHAVLAHVACGYDWDWPVAKAAFRHALQLDPRKFQTHQAYAIGLCCAGEFETAIHQLEIARELEPGSMSVRVNFGFVFHCSRRGNMAVDELAACVALEPGFPYARYRLAAALEACGRFDEAFSHFNTLRAMPGAEVQGLVGMSCGSAIAGRQAEARSHVAELLAMSEKRYISAYFFAEIFTSLDEIDEAFLWLDKAYEERAMVMPSLRNNPRFDRLRNDPRYSVFERRVGYWQ